MSRPLARLLAVASSALMLLLTAVPAMAASGTTPTAGKHDGVIGSLGGLAMTAVVGIVVGIICYALLPAGPAPEHDDHH